jgi:hypothetical protein
MPYIKMNVFLAAERSSRPEIPATLVAIEQVQPVPGAQAPMALRFGKTFLESHAIQYENQMGYEPLKNWEI